MMTLIRSLLFSTLLTMVYSSSFLGAQRPATDPVVSAVQDWYKAFDGAAGIRAQYQGYVGGRFDVVHRALAPSLQLNLSQAAFEELYAELAHMKLLQAHRIRLDQTRGKAEVFVEEERTIVSRKGEQQIPGIAWYEGTLELTETTPGLWRISAINLRPEDIISMTYGGHQPWRGDAQGTAQASATTLRKRECPISGPALSRQPTSPVDFAITCSDDGERYQVREVQLHSGEWRTIEISAVR